MSKDTYLKGFCKAAAARGVDPEELARYALSKRAEGEGPGFWASVKSSIGDAAASAKDWWNKPENAVWRPLIGSGVGALGGAGIGAITGGKRGAGIGAAVGALAGGVGGAVDWDSISKRLDDISKRNKQRNEQRKAIEDAIQNTVTNGNRSELPEGADPKML